MTKTVLISGASSGIGKQLAIEFSKKGYKLVLVARREVLLKQLKEELIDTYHNEVDYFVCDISVNAKAVYDYCHDNNIKVDILVNNAGYGDFGRFIESDLDKDLGMIELNNKALVSLTYYFIKDMKENGYGHILNVASVASFMPGPYMAVYYASKAFVLSFSMALRQELKKDNIKVSVLCPAPTKSDFWKVANGETTMVYNNIFARTTCQAAKSGIKAIEKNKAFVIDGVQYKILMGIVKLLPIELTTKIVSFIQAKTKKKV